MRNATNTTSTIPTTTDPVEIHEHLHSIKEVPEAILPSGPARQVLRWLAWGGFDVYAYASGGPTYGTWCAWLGPLADVRPGHDGRVTLEEWGEHWHELVAEMGFTTKRPAAPAHMTEGEVTR